MPTWAALVRVQQAHHCPLPGRQQQRRRPRGAEKLALLNQTDALLRLQTNVVPPQQKLIEKHPVGAKVPKCFDPVATPYRKVPDN